MDGRIPFSLREITPTLGGRECTAGETGIGLSRLFGLSGWPDREPHQRNQTDQIDQIDKRDKDRGASLRS